ncbi:hypothetical protein NPIL_335531 [Nephila pilipes]|uniref:Uncharacterized protein n=1 Tax=Nephila pilipes TaxID=299642 RepID=A0A8X6P2F6_NEPPI|nr:hypothetical protein NPIL_335531 [Nephila pilipes]
MKVLELYQDDLLKSTEFLLATTIVRRNENHLARDPGIGMAHIVMCGGHIGRLKLSQIEHLFCLYRIRYTKTTPVFTTLRLLHMVLPIADQFHREIFSINVKHLSHFLL